MDTENKNDSGMSPLTAPQPSYSPISVNKAPEAESPASKNSLKNTSFRNGCFWGGAIGISIIFLAFLLIIIMGAVGVYTIIASSNAVTKNENTLSSKFEQILIDEVDNGATKSNAIFVLPLQGTITSGNFLTNKNSAGVVTDDYVIQALNYLRNQDPVDALILDINSPGGGVTASDCIYNEIKLFKKETNIPVVAMFEGLACSGGYYIAMSADSIMALPTNWTGSIGVIMELPEIEGLMGKVGVNVNTIKSKPYKDIGSSYRKMKPDERQLLQSLVTQSYDRFVDIVAEGRKGKISKDKVKELADGRIYSSQQALKHKLIDKIGYRQDLYKMVRDQIKAPDADIILLNKKESWLDSLGSMCSNITEASANFNSLMSKSSPCAPAANSVYPAVPMYIMPADVVKP